MSSKMMHFKDCTEVDLKKYKIPCEHREECASERKKLNEDVEVNSVILRRITGGTQSLRDVRKGVFVDLPKDTHRQRDMTCTECGSICLSMG